MKTYVEKYTKICKSTSSGKNSFKKSLKEFYISDPIDVSLSNNDDDVFQFFPKVIEKYEKEFERLSLISISHRGIEMSDYLASGYIASEINSSLRAEGVNSSRKIVDQVIKSMSEGKKLGIGEIEQLIRNYYQALQFILNKNRINEQNIRTLYTLLTTDIHSDVLEHHQLYREEGVSIGNDFGLDPKKIKDKMNMLITFINSEELENKIQTKAIIAEYIFENIHPYIDFNGRMGRLIHLWILINNSANEFWKLIFLSEAIYAFKLKLDTTYRRIVKAKNNNANIDLTYFIGRYYEMLIEHSEAYINMKEMVNEMSFKPTRHLRLFIIDLLTMNGADGKWYDISEFKRRYPDYSNTVYNRVLSDIRNSKLFEIREGKPIQFRLIKKQI